MVAGLSTDYNMLLNKINILCTRPLNPGLIHSAKEHGLEIEVVPFIKTDFIESELLTERVKEFAGRSVAAVFTSMNAAEAVIRMLQGVKPSWVIFCLGKTTLGILKNYFGEEAIEGSAKNATALAERILSSAHRKNIVFFLCNYTCYD